MQAAASLAALAVAEPSFAAAALSATMAQLSEARAQLPSAVAAPEGDAHDAAAAAGTGAPRGALTETAKRTINSVHGYSLGVAALLGASTRFAPSTARI